MFKLALVLTALAVSCSGAVSNTYLLFTLENLVIPEFLNPRDRLPRNTHFKVADNTIILVHGHHGNAKSYFNTVIKNSILEHQRPHNIVVVDWSYEAAQKYSAARQSVPRVAENLANFILWLEFEARLFRTTLHLVGFDLGAHIVGQAGRRLNQGSNRIGRITGLDPSGSRWGASSGRLADTDALYVEVIHTDTRGLTANGIGTPIGDINFYVNGGSNQPGCFTHTCSHNRAFEVFAASMFNFRLLGSPCKSELQNTLDRCKGEQVHMGGLLHSKTGSKIYRVNTRRKWPF